jgi:hypothetical protein
MRASVAASALLWAASAAAGAPMAPADRGATATRFGSSLGGVRLEPAAAEPLPLELVGATWRWIRLVSPGEDIAVAEPDHYTLTFDAAGGIALRADCNRGAGVVAFPEPGAVRMGPLAHLLA